MGERVRVEDWVGWGGVAFGGSNIAILFPCQKSAFSGGTITAEDF